MDPSPKGQVPNIEHAVRLLDSMRRETIWHKKVYAVYASDRNLLMEVLAFYVANYGQPS